jgi:hypothetical protein
MRRRRRRGKRRDRAESGGKKKKESPEKPLEKYRYNFTDPGSRIMKVGNGNHFE